MKWRSLSGLGLALGKVRQHQKAIDYTRRALEITLKIGDKRNSASLLSNLAGRFGSFYDYSNNEKYLDSCKNYIQLSLPLLKETNNLVFLAQAYSQLASIAYTRKQYQNALSYCDSILNLPNVAALYGQRANVYQLLAENAVRTYNYTQASKLADSVYMYGKRNNNLETMAVALQQKSIHQEKLGNYALANSLLRKWAVMQDSSLRLTQLRTVVELEQKYNKVQNEKTIGELQQTQQITVLQNQILIAVCVLTGLLLMIIFVLFRQRALRNQHSLLLTELRLQRARMNPHFLFNLLTSLQAIALNPATSGTTARYISKFANLMRQTLESTYTELLPLAEECAYLKNYLELQLIRFPNLFTYAIEIHLDVEKQDVSIPPMLVQPFVENAIEHGFQHTLGKKHVQLDFTILNNNLVVSIVNSGWNDTHTTIKEHTSRASTIVRDRLSLLNKQHSTNASFEIRTSLERAEYMVTVTLPLL